LTPPDQVTEDSLKNAAAVVLESSLLVENTIKNAQLFDSYPGKVIVLPDTHNRYIWLGSHLKEADIQKGGALAARSLAEGQEVKPITTSSPWLIFAYVIAGLVGLQILVGVLAVALSF
jgi:hypothetical protein